VRTSFVVGVVVALIAGPALAQTPGAGQPTLLDPHPMVPHSQVAPAPAQSARPAAAAAKPAKKPRATAKAPSTPEARSAAALALSADPVFDEGTYQRIKEALLSYSAIQVRGGWPALPADVKLGPEATGPAVALLRRHLVISDDLAPEQEEGEVYDAPVIDAVKRFQLRHGLEATGSVDARTLKALNVPVAERIKQLEASLERLLGMDFVFAERYVVVNIPAAFVEAISHDKVERRYRVIVGKIDKPSPTLTAFITAVNLNPTWTVPLSITKSEIRAHMRRDPSYLSRMHMRVLGARDEEIDPQTVDWSSDRSPNFTVRQDSGGFNALGNLKIDMPNPYSVYMHDTTWNRAAIDAGIAAGGLKIINLPHKMPVAWVYLTGWVTRDGTIQFRDDVYKHDQQLDRDKLDETVRAGGFVAPLSREAQQAAPPPREVKQVSNLDSR